MCVCVDSLIPVLTLTGMRGREMHQSIKPPNLANVVCDMFVYLVAHFKSGFLINR